MLWLGDVHGNFEKVKAFLAYRPEEKHGFVGDYFDSFVATEKQMIETFEYIVDHDCITLSGNHDNQYYANSNDAKVHLYCSGYRGNTDFVALVEKYKDRLLASYVDGDYIVTHGGIHKELYKSFENIHVLSDWINSEFDTFKNDTKFSTAIFNSRIFNIAACRGGWNQWGGPFWFDYRMEKLAPINQIFGHSKTKGGVKVLYSRKKVAVCVDTKKFECYNSKTHMVEDFFPEELQESRSKLEIVY